MKHTYFLFLFFLFACKKENDSIPGYINIDSIELNDQSTENITDAWIFINDNLQGVYELPAQFPVLNLNDFTLRIKAGIKNNGIASNRTPYPFYSSFINDVRLESNKTMNITPTVEYLENTSFFLEDFENGINLSTSSISDTSVIILSDGNNNYGAGILSDSLITFEITTDPITDLPQQGAPVFLELDYKSNTEFLVGVYINYTLVVKRDLLWINPKDNWNKIYINLTQIISEGINAPSFSIFVGMKRNFLLEKNELHLDNLKVVY